MEPPNTIINQHHHIKNDQWSRLKMNPTDSVLVVVVLLVLLQLLNHPFPGKVVGKVILGYHHYAKSLVMIHYYTKLSVWIWTLQIYFLISSFISSNSMYVIHRMPQTCLRWCPRHVLPQTCPRWCPRHASDDAPDMPQGTWLYLALHLCRSAMIYLTNGESP